MKWWIAAMSSAAVMLAGVSIWLGSNPTASPMFALDLFVANAIVANIAVFLGIINAIHLDRRVWRFAFRVLVIFLPLVLLVSQLTMSASSANGPFCAQNLADAGVTGVVCPPLWISILEFAWVVAPATAALMYVLWPHKRNALVMAGYRK